jgi:hypothetical protein
MNNNNNKLHWRFDDRDLVASESIGMGIEYFGNIHIFKFLTTSKY